MKPGVAQQSAELTLAGSTVACGGRWTARQLAGVESQLASLDWPPGDIRIDLSGMLELDTVGAWLLHQLSARLESQGRSVAFEGLHERAAHLLQLVEEKGEALGEARHPHMPGMLEDVGRETVEHFHSYGDFLAFLGRLSLVTIQGLARPFTLRWRAIIEELQTAGVNALPIVGLLAFLMGIVIAYQGGIVLRDYGANIFVADLVSLAMLRELAPLITAIIVAGRTGSAYTAQIGTMMVTEEVDALRSLGVRPMEVLVLPKLLALTIALPLLTVYADIMGLLGGMFMANALLGLSASSFIERLTEAVSMKSYLSGVGKAPVFALIIASVGCFRGFEVFGSAESVGRKTTVSVVQSIFLVIVVDAAFSIAFSKLGI